jgi:RTX calcium-binding nonapeptide repeat (4 copies)
MRSKTSIAVLAASVAMLATGGVALADNITGTQGPDVLTGTSLDDHIVAKKGDDQVSALAGNDNVSGNKGNDVLDGDEGNDTLTGNKGADQINGGPGNDLIKARGDGKKSGPDTITCGEDAEEYSNDSDTVLADKNDVVAADCEIVDRPGKPDKPDKPDKPKG